MDTNTIATTATSVMMYKNMLFNNVEQYVKINYNKIFATYIVINVAYIILTLVYLLYVYIKYTYNILKRVYTRAHITNNLDQPIIIKHEIKCMLDMQDMQVKQVKQDKLLITINNYANTSRVVTVAPRVRHHMQTRSKKTM